LIKLPRIRGSIATRGPTGASQAKDHETDIVNPCSLPEAEFRVFFASLEGKVHASRFWETYHNSLWTKMGLK
jgi:hypothetical protein